MTIPAGLPADLHDAYEAAATHNVLAALNAEVFFGYFSVCADGKGHGGNTTFPGLDWGQSAEALLWLGRHEEVLASWEYVKGFQRDDGLLPFAILPDLENRTVMVEDRYPLTGEAGGAVFVHWVPGNPLRILANVTFLQMAAAIHDQLGDDVWLQAQLPPLRQAARWLCDQVDATGLIPGGGFYVERPVRLQFDGVAHCCGTDALRRSAELFDQAGDARTAHMCRTTVEELTTAFREHFWAGDHCVEYIHPERGPIDAHGLTDVDWAALATGILRDDQVVALWPRLREETGFLYDGMPTGISTRPETYQLWEMQHIDGHDLAAMGRAWFLECQARHRMGDREGILQSLRRVADRGRAEGWSWRERYYAASVAAGSHGRIDHYCEYPANLIRIVHRFL